MGLDLYAGSLTRYFTRDFQTPSQRPAAGGKGATTVRVTLEGRARSERRAPDPGLDPGGVRRRVMMWRAALAQRLGEQMTGRLDWDESNASLWMCEQPTWTGYGGLVLFAAYTERPDLAPAAIDIDAWAADAAYKAARADDESTYLHLYRAEMWVPAAFPWPIRMEGLTRNTVAVGSLTALVEELADLNARTWEVDLRPDALTPPEVSTDFEAAAWRGFSVFYDMARRAKWHGLPMVMDY